MSQLNCPICQSDSQKCFISKHNYQIMKCQSKLCGHLFVADPTIYQGLMHKGLSASEINAQAKQLEQNYDQRDESLIEYWRSKKFIDEQTKVLDFGSGSGHILKSLRKRYPSINLTSIEGSQPLREHLIICGFNTVENIDNVEETFDSILLIEVIEHVSDPVGLLKKFKSRLNKDGQIFLTTPCGELRTGSRKTNAYDIETHIQFFTEKSLKLACELAGLKPIIYEFIDAMYPQPKQLMKMKKLSQNIKRAIKQQYRGFSHLTGFITLP